ncbi:MAG: polynucleotide adenylyltransferase PcnB [Myxococcales bacterium]|nr:polynucleotide adenylyltransferase PcnB [Myxococcota bacterium]MDW8280670.1 polynucleotide adenylyltransferase PcnB [Myxococcales bacterium]
MLDPAIPLDLIDADAQKVVRRLARNGYQAYLVGGCVRDLLLGRQPKDFDVATSATPAEVRELFRNCRIIGRRFRLAHVFFGSKIIETATFRANPREVADDETQGSGELLIRRDNVFGTAEEDARRRDFTINGLFYDIDKGQILDYVQGQRDLAERSIRTIGDPDIRFQEDPVRILRAVKFAARLGFDIEDHTYQAVIRHRRDIVKSAPPRVLEEVYRLLRGGAALESFVLLRETGLLGVLIPQVDALVEREPICMDPVLGALDALVGRGEVPPNAALLCVLLGPALVAASERREPALQPETLEPILAQLQVPRRDAERARRIILAQRHVAQFLRHGRPASLCRADWFQDALALHAIVRVAGGDKVEQVLAELAPLRCPTEATEGEAAGQERSPRRRRRLRRRRSGEAAAGTMDDIGEEDEPLDNEEAAVAAFTAALSARTDD